MLRLTERNFLIKAKPRYMRGIWNGLRKWIALEFRKRTMPTIVGAKKNLILTLLKKDNEAGWLYTYNTMDFHGLSGTYTFQELLAVCGQQLA